MMVKKRKQMTAESWHPSSLLLGALSVALIAMLGCAIWLSASTSVAQADDEASLSSTKMTVNLSRAGDASGTTSNLDRTTYVTGDTPVLKWKGAQSGDDLIIPSEIRVNGTVRYSVSDLVKVNQLQTDNTEYRRRMGSTGNMATFDTLLSYITKEHSVSLGSMSLATNTVSITWTRVKPVYRLYNMITSEHLFTTNKAEYDGFWEKSTRNEDAWIGEGISWLSPSSSSNETVYRFYNAGLGAMGQSSHYYSKDQSEIVTLGKNGWVNDGAANSFQSGGSTQIWTCYNEALGSAHHYTSSKDEWSSLAAHGWNLERDKNGSNGVFQGLVATSWSYSDNYYKVNHVVAGTTFTEWKEGRAGSQTNATALTFPGYSAGTITNTSISSDNSTVVNIYYSPRTYKVTFNTNGGSSVAAKNVTFGYNITGISNPTKSGAEFAGWTLDSAGTVSFNASSFKMPAQNITLYAKWKTGSTYTVKFNKNNNKASGSMANMTRSIGDGKQLSANAFTYVDGDKVYGFKSWNTRADGKGTTVSDKATLDLTSTPGSTVTLYAQWTTEDLNPYWIAAAKATTTGNTAQTANISNKDYTNPETSVERTASEIKADIEIMKDSSNPNYSSTLQRYRNYMSSDKYHLYTKIAEGNADDCYFEFRIVGIGGHTSTGNNTDGSKYNDGSVLTFQGTHALPYAFRVNSDDTNEGGWLSSDLGININSEQVLATYNVGLTSELSAVQKWNRVGSTSGTIDNTMISSNDRLWIMSYSELIGGSPSSWSSAGLDKEGDQYEFWKSRGLSPITANRAASELAKTRSGGETHPVASGVWHLRSASPKNTTDFLHVDSYGNAATSLAANTYASIVPCFTMGTTTNTVSFDTGEGGTKVDSQSVPQGGYADAPTGTIRSAKEGYHLEGWYTDQSYSNRFNFETTPITQSITLYAKFEPDTTTRYRVDVYEELVGGGYSSVRTRYVDATGTTDTTSDTSTITPTSGFEFDYANDVTITGDGDAIAKVYHKRKSYSVTFNMKGVETTSAPANIASQKFGTLITATNPVAADYQFAGWYLDQGTSTTRFDLAGNTMPAQDLVLYAKWNPLDTSKVLYSVKHYQQGVDGNYPSTPSETTMRQGKAGDNTDAQPLSYDGFTLREDVVQKQITADGNTEVSIYYKRNTYKVEFIDNTKTEEGVVVHTIESQLYGAPITKASAPASEHATRKFEGWAMDDINNDEFDFEHGTMPNKNVKFYSKWTIDMAWVAPSATKTTGNTQGTVNQPNDLYQGSPTTAVKKYITTLAEDIAILRNPNHEQYADKVAEYEGYMNNDDYHLYTAWTGQADDEDGLHYENTFLEFRVIQVGEHDGDGSVLTLQGTHTIPTAFNISDSVDTKSGWSGSPLREKMVQMGNYYKSRVTNMFKTVEKQTMQGGGVKTLTTTEDDFWIASATEIAGTDANGAGYFGTAEGSQYEWFKNIGITSNGSANPALVKRTRAGNVPKDVSDGSYQGSYWTRTPDQRSVSTNKTAIISDTGYQRRSFQPNLNTGVVVCFAV